MRNVLDRPDVGGDVFACDAVASRGGAHEAAVAILKGDAEAVDLQFGDIRHGSLEIIQPAPQPLVERLQLVFVVGVVETEHRLGMTDRGEAFGRPAADALGR